MDKPKRWVKNVIQKSNPMAVCPYLTQSWVKTTQHFFRIAFGICVYIYTHI